MSHIPPPTLINLTAEHWRLMADYFGWSMTLKQIDIARVIWQYSQDQSRRKMERAIEKMQAANQAKDYKAFYRAQAEFYAALRLSDEADEYYQRHLADLPPLSGQDKGELERTNT